MRKIREVLRLKFERGLGHRAIGLAAGISKGSVADYLARAEAAGLAWAEATLMSDAEVERRLLPAARVPRAQRARGDRLRMGARRAAPDGRDAAASLARVQRRCDREPRCRAALPIQPVLRPLRGLPRQARAFDAADASRGRKGVRRLLRQEARVHPSHDRRGDSTDVDGPRSKARPAMRALPKTRYVLAEWRNAKVDIEQPRDTAPRAPRQRARVPWQSATRLARAWRRF